MDGLRLILLIMGALVVVGIYLYARAQSNRKGRYQARVESTPEPEFEVNTETFSATPDDDPIAEELARMEKLVQEDASTPAAGEPLVISATKAKTTASAMPNASPTARAPEQDKIIVLYVVAPSHSPFRAKDLLPVLERAGLEYGDMQIYHRFKTVDGVRHEIFGVANLVEPGTFAAAHADEHFTTRGLSLFLQLPVGIEGVIALEDMVATAKTLADELRGELRDDTRSALSRQRIEHLRSEILEFERRQRLLSAQA